MNGSKLWILKDDYKHNIQNTSVCTKEYSTQTLSESFEVDD